MVLISIGNPPYVETEPEMMSKSLSVGNSTRYNKKNSLVTTIHFQIDRTEKEKFPSSSAAVTY